MLIAIALHVSLSFLVPVDEDVDGLLERAARLVDLGQPAVAAELYGQALSHRTLREDLQAQQLVAQTMTEQLGDQLDAETLGALMSQLPAKHNGVFVSAHSLARVLAADAMAQGEYLFGHELEAVLVQHDKLRHSGEAAAVFADVGQALAMLARFEAQGSVKLLERSLEQALEQGWLEEAIAVGTELAASQVSLGDDDEAREVMDTLVALFPGGGDLVLLSAWRELVTARLSTAPGSVLTSYRSLMAYLPEEPTAESPAEPSSAEDGAPVPGPPGAEAPEDAEPGEPGAGLPANGGGGDTTPTAAAQALVGRRTVDLLAIERDGSQWLISSALGDGLELRLDLAPGLIVLDHGGLIFALDGPEVALLSISLTTEVASPELMDVFSPTQATYLLADGETIRFDSRAGVTVR